MSPMHALTSHDRYIAGRFRFNSGDYYDPPEIAAAAKAQDDLIARTWKQDRSMNRDEKRLYAKYQTTLDAHDLIWFERLKAHELST